MDPKELKKLQEKLKKDQEVLKKAQEELSEGQLKLKEGFKALEAEKKRLGPLSEIEPVEELKVDPKWLKGQIFRGKKEGEPVKKAGKKTKTRVFIPFQRPLEVADILAFTVYSDEVIIATADGRKFRVKK